MDSVDSKERLVRVETTVEHISEKVDSIEYRQQLHEAANETSFAQLREGAIRLQMSTENLVKAIQQQNSSHADADEKLAGRITIIEDKLGKLTQKVVGITLAGGLVWVLVGEKVLTLLGLK